MKYAEPPAIAKPKIRSIVVPSDIYEAVTSSGGSLMDLTVFGKLRKYASLEQIAAYVYLNDNLVVNGCRVSTDALRDVVTLGDGSNAEMSAVFHSMAKSDEIIKQAQLGLQEFSNEFSNLLAQRHGYGTARTVSDTSMKNTLGSALTASNDLPYQLKTSGSNVFVVVGSGFDKYVGTAHDKKDAEKFIRAFLESCNGLFSPSEIARHPLFKTFLLSLAV